MLSWMVFTVVCFGFLFFFKQKTAYEMRISDWSSDVCSSDLEHRPYAGGGRPAVQRDARTHPPDRGEGAAQAEAPVAVAEDALFLGSVGGQDSSSVREIGRASCRERVCQYV